MGAPSARAPRSRSPPTAPHVQVRSCGHPQNCGRIELRPARPLCGFGIGETAGSLKAAVEQQRNCQFKWYFAAGIPTWAPPAQSPHCPQPRYSLVAPLTLSIHLLERREQRVFFTPGRMSDWGRCRVARTVVQNTKHCTTQKFRGRFTKKIKREKDR